jgi:hypothetical protein
MIHVSQRYISPSFLKKKEKSAALVQKLLAVDGQLPNMVICGNHVTHTLIFPKCFSPPLIIEPPLQPWKVPIEPPQLNADCQSPEVCFISKSLMPPPLHCSVSTESKARRAYY